MRFDEIKEISKGLDIQKTTKKRIEKLLRETPPGGVICFTDPTSGIKVPMYEVRECNGRKYLHLLDK